METDAAEVRPMVREDENRACFLRLIDEYGPALRRLSNAYLERNADREDLFQDVAIALWQALPKFRGDASERTWLYRIAHNVAITASSKVNRRSRREDDLPSLRPSRRRRLTPNNSYCKRKNANCWSAQFAAFRSWTGKSSCSTSKDSAIPRWNR